MERRMARTLDRKRVPAQKAETKTLRRSALRPLRLFRREKNEDGYPGPQRTGAILHARNQPTLTPPSCLP